MDDPDSIRYGEGDRLHILLSLWPSATENRVSSDQLIFVELTMPCLTRSDSCTIAVCIFHIVPHFHTFGICH